MKTKERTVIDELLEELTTLEKKKAKIFQEVEELTKKSNPRPGEVVSLVRRLRKLISNFQGKMEAIEKMASKN